MLSELSLYECIAWYFIPVVFPWSADDMGLGKTLTMIALILALKKKPKEEEKEDKKLETWISKNGIYNPLVKPYGSIIFWEESALVPRLCFLL